MWLTVQRCVASTIVLVARNASVSRMTSCRAARRSRIVSGRPSLCNGCSGCATRIMRRGMISAAGEQRLVGAGDYRLDVFDARVRALRIQLVEALEEQPGGKDNLRGDADLGFP